MVSPASLAKTNSPLPSPPPEYRGREQILAQPSAAGGLDGKDSRSIGLHSKRFIWWLGVIAASAAALLPVLWLVSTSLKPPGEVLAYPPTFIPSAPTLDNYRKVFAEADLGVYLLNSLLAGSISTILAILIGGLAAYGLARFTLRFNLNYLLSLWILSMRMFPGLVLVIPYFLFFKQVRMLDSVAALIVAYLGLNIPFVVWMMSGFFRELPRELEEAAIIDGCGGVRTLVQIILPIAAPGLTATAIFCFILTWNEFLFALILTSFNAKTVPVELSGYITDKGLDWGPMSAVGVVAVLPVVVAVMSLQRWFVRGLALGAVKG